VADGAPPLALLNRNDNAPNESGNGDHTDWDDKRVHVGGRSRVIHACLVGV